MTQRAGWYLVGYDVRDPKRMVRLHRVLTDRGLWVQRSVFLVQGTASELERLMDELAERIHVREDDLRAWPVDEPSDIWFGGIDLLRGDLLIVADEDAESPEAEGAASAAITRWLARWRNGG